MRGDVVIVRVFGDKPEVRRVWDSNDKLVYITDDSKFKLLSEGNCDIKPIGFPREDVFEFNKDLGKPTDGKLDWSKLVHYN